MLETSIIGAILGLLGRLAPEFLNFFKNKDELSHEIKMLEIQAEVEKTKVEIAKIQGEVKVEEKYVDYSIANLQAIAEVSKAEAEASKNNYKWVNAIISMQRPYITFFMFNLYVVVKLLLIWYGIDMGLGMIEILANTWSDEDAGLLSMIVSYLYLNRTLEKHKG